MLDEEGNSSGDENIILEWNEPYQFVDLLEFNGDLYISGYVGSYDREKFGYDYQYFRGEENDQNEIERITKIYREKYEVILWKYNEQTGQLENCSKGSNIEMDKNYMVWYVKGIDEFKYNGGSSVGYKGRSRIYKYVINEQLQVESRINTEEFESIWN